MRRPALLALALILASAPLLAQPAPTTPPRRAHHALVYDPVRARVLLAGGSSPRDGGSRFDVFDDLWAWDGRAWQALPSSGDRVSSLALAWDARARRVLSLGGYPDTLRGLFRVLERDGWRTIGRVAQVLVSDPGAVWDARRERLVAFGGSPGPGRFAGETWEWDGTRWTQANGLMPSPRAAHVMVHDARRGVTVVFGGMTTGAPGGPPASLGDTWEYDGTQWRLRATDGPLPRHGAGAAYDARRGVVVLFGGAGGGGFQGDTWEWDGRAWHQRATDGPEPRAMGVLAYDAARDRTVLFGGRTGWPDGDMGDTWEWDGRRWTKIAGSGPR